MRMLASDNKPWTEEDKRLTKAWSDRGMLTTEIARRLDRSPQQVGNFIRRELSGAAMRICLNCRDTFSSEGVHNRLCSPCKIAMRTMAP